MTRTPKDLSQYLDIVSRIRVDHNGYVSILDELTQAYDVIGHTATPVFILLTGESRTGKSSVVREVLDTYHPRHAADRTIQSVVCGPGQSFGEGLAGIPAKGIG